LWINERPRATVLPQLAAANRLKAGALSRARRSPRNLRKSGVLASLLRVSRSVSETYALEGILEPRIGAQGIKTGSQQDARVKSLFVSFL